MITTELLTKFFDNACSREEAEEVYRYLQAHPEEVDRWWSESEWRTFTEKVDVGSEKSLEMWETIGRKRRPMIRRIEWAKVAAVAAAAALVAGYWLVPSPDTASPVAAVPSRDTLFINRAHIPVRETLQDGSVVELFPGSSMTMHNGFDSDRRVVHLTGEATFNVATEKYRPFTVFTRELSTTVLGTVFHITETGRTTSVRLLQGKVVVKSLARPDMVAVLQPGNECTFDEKHNILRKINQPVLAAKPLPAPELGSLGDSSFAETDSAILFKNLPLPRVFQILGKSYATPIYFDRAALSARKFTGNIDKKQSLETVLNGISLLNDLTVEPQEGGFRLVNH